MNKYVLRKISYGLYVISTLNGDKPTGCISNTVMQITYDTVAISLNHSNFTNECIKKTGKFAVSILPEKVEDNVIGNFGFKSGREFDKFKDVKVLEIDGLSVLKDSCGYIICEVVNKLETETHTVFLGKIKDGEILNDEPPITYAYYHDVKKGSSPKAAPNYIASDTENADKVDAETITQALDENIRYRCSICGYVYEGDITKEPDTYTCPICSYPKSAFERI